MPTFISSNTHTHARMRARGRGCILCKFPWSALIPVNQNNLSIVPLQSLRFCWNLMSRKSSNYFVLLFCFVLFLDRVSRVALAVWNSLCRPGWPQIQKSTYLCLPSAGIEDMHHHRQAKLIVSYSLVIFIIYTYMCICIYLWIYNETSWRLNQFLFLLCSRL